MDDLLNLHQNTVFLRREAIAAGYSDKDLHRQLRAGVIVRPRYGGYVSAPVWQAADEREQHLICCQVVMLQHGDRVMLSHTSAAAAAGLALFEPDYRTVHVTRLDDQSGRIEAGVQHHVPTSAAGHAVRHGEFLRADDVTATIGAALLSGVENGLVVADSFLARHPDSAELLHAAYAEVARHPFARRLQLVVRMARPGGTNPFETRVRYAMWRGHLPEPELQWHVYDADGTLIGITDFAWPDHHLLGEADGRLKYGRLLGPNPTAEEISRVMVAEKRREDLLREITGFGMIRYVFGELYTPDRMCGRTRAMLSRYQHLAIG